MPATTVPLEVVEGLTGDLSPAHDPDLAREGAWYYVFGTGEGVPIRRSRDLVHWEDVGSVFDRPHPAWLDEDPAYADWVEPEMGLGAPTIAWFGDRWHLYYHAHQFATNNAVTGHATNVTLDPDDPEYRWADDGLIMSSTTDDAFSVLDANVVVDDDGTPWMTFGSFWLGIQLVEIDPDSGARREGAPMELLAARDPWVLGVEASSVVRHDGWWYLFVSWGFCCQGVDTDYEIRVGRSRDLAGPYLDRDGVPMLEGGGTLLLGASGRVIGPGHGDVRVFGPSPEAGGPDDSDAVLVHHWYDGDNGGETMLGVKMLSWDDAGWPVVAGVPPS